MESGGHSPRSANSATAASSVSRVSASRDRRSRTAHALDSSSGRRSSVPIHSACRSISRCNSRPIHSAASSHVRVVDNPVISSPDPAATAPPDPPKCPEPQTPHAAQRTYPAIEREDLPSTVTEAPASRIGWMVTAWFFQSAPHIDASCLEIATGCGFAWHFPHFPPRFTPLKTSLFSKKNDPNFHCTPGISPIFSDSQAFLRTSKLRIGGCMFRNWKENFVNKVPPAVPLATTGVGGPRKESH
jgi:hypothetical protein